MKVLSAITERFFSNDTKVLMKAGLLEGRVSGVDGESRNELTAEAVDFLQALFAEQNKDALVTYAKEKLEKEKERKKTKK